MSRLRSHLPAAGGFAALTVAFLWPVFRHFPTRVLSQGGDGSAFLWAYWAMPRALGDLENPFVTDGLFHPVGANLAFHTTTPLEMAAAWPLSQLFGLGVAVNVLQVSAVLLSALGAYLLALHVWGDRRAAFFAGVAFAFVPYRFVHMGGHFNLIHTEFLPFGLLAALRFIEQPSRRRAGVLGLVLGLTFLTDAYYAVFLGLSIAVLCLLRLYDLRQGQTLARLGLVAGVAVLVAAPLLVPMAQAVAAGELDPLPGWGGADVFSADLISWLVPPDRHPFWGHAVEGLRDRLPAGGEGIAYPGLVVIALALGGRYVADRAARRCWVVLAAVMGVLALGPFLQVAGRSGSGFSYLGREFVLPLPYMVIRAVPLLNGVRVPGRFAIVAILALDVLAAGALAALLHRRSRLGVASLGLALVLVVVEFLPGRLAQHPVAVPAPYHRIAADGGTGAVLEIPLQWQSGTAVVGDRSRDHTIFLYYATVHGRPLVSGYLSRYPDERLERLTAIPMYRQVLALVGDPGFDDPAEFDADDLRRLGIGYVVYHRDRPEPKAYEYLDTLGLERLSDDGTVLAWKVG